MLGNAVNIFAVTAHICNNFYLKQQRVFIKFSVVKNKKKKKKQVYILKHAKQPITRLKRKH